MGTPQAPGTVPMHRVPGLDALQLRGLPAYHRVEVAPPEDALGGGRVAVFEAPVRRHGGRPFGARQAARATRVRLPSGSRRAHVHAGDAVLVPGTVRGLAASPRCCGWLTPVAHVDGRCRVLARPAVVERPPRAPSFSPFRASAVWRRSSDGHGCERMGHRATGLAGWRPGGGVVALHCRREGQAHQLA